MNAPAEISEEGHTAADLLQDLWQELARPENVSVSDAWRVLADFDLTLIDEHSRAVVALLTSVASFHLTPDAWHSPYVPMLQLADRRSADPSDFSSYDIDLLGSVVSRVPHNLLRARTFDLLSCLSTGSSKIEFSKEHLSVLVAEEVSLHSWPSLEDMWDRGLLVARRFGSPLSTLQAEICEKLLEAVIREDEPRLVAGAASLLGKHRLGDPDAETIANRLLALANNYADDPAIERRFLRDASEWYARANMSAESSLAVAAEVESLYREAESISITESPQSPMRAAHLFELALRRVRDIPRTARAELGIDTYPSTFARRIRELGARGLGSMRSFSSDSIDLSSMAAHAREAVSGKPPIEALIALVTLEPLSSFSQAKEEAEALLRAHPLQTLFSTVHYSRDGRVIYRSAGAANPSIYGVDSNVWRQMIRAYELRINILAKAMIWPAFVQATNEHRLGISFFSEVLTATGLVPSDRVQQVAVALEYGYRGDFSTAMQLLVPQVENLVRHHLSNAGEPTTVITTEQTEEEIGLSALMEREAVAGVFGVDVSFEIRALLCGPIGPNLRNTVAHGLLSDAESRSSVALYLWWIVLRLAVLPFWSMLHDAEAAEAREPSQPEDPEPEQSR